MKLRVNVVRAPEGSLSSFRSPLSLEQLRQYGFRHMLMDIIDAPEPALRFFCRYHNLHNVPIADGLSPAQIQQVLAFVFSSSVYVYEGLCEHSDDMHFLCTC